jgi:hypothetical protein
MESALGNNRINLADVARVAAALLPGFMFDPNLNPNLAEVLEIAKKVDGVVIIALDAAILYGEQGNSRPHAMIIDSTSEFHPPRLPSWVPNPKTAESLIAMHSERQSVVDPDPSRDGKSFSLIDAVPAFVKTDGQYLIVRRAR